MLAWLHMVMHAPRHVVALTELCVRHKHCAGRCGLSCPNSTYPEPQCIRHSTIPIHIKSSCSRITAPLMASMVHQVSAALGKWCGFVSSTVLTRSSLQTHEEAQQHIEL